MEIDFWEQRWNQKQIAFHLPAVNPCLVKFWPTLMLPETSQVLVPLCGKSIDLTWLANNQYSVLGIECSEQATRAFFEEQKLTATRHQADNFNIYKTDSITLFQGDFFALNNADLKNITAVYDRASLVALPPEMRRKYVKLLVDLLPQNVEILLITLEYNQSLMSGPPFSVVQDEVEELFQPDFNVELLDRQDVLHEYDKFRERGLDYLTECVYRLHR